MLSKVRGFPQQYADGTMHVLITPKVQGTMEAVEAATELLNSTEHQGSLGAKWFGDSTLDDIKRCTELSAIRAFH